MKQQTQPLNPKAFAVGRSCPKAVCHPRHSNPNNQPLCAPCQLQRGPDEGGWGDNGCGDNGDCSGPLCSLGGGSPGRGPVAATSSELPTSGRFGVPLRRACAHRDIQGMLEVAVNTFVKRRSVNMCMVKTKSLCRETASWC